MTDQPKDVDIWLAFIKELQEKSSVNPVKKRNNIQRLDISISSQIELYDEDWEELKRQVDRINDTRYNYTTQQPLLNIKKKLEVTTPLPSHYFAHDYNVNAVILGLDRTEKKELMKLRTHQIIELDLHGYRLPEAYEKLKITFQIAQQQKVKILKVITGKGRPNLQSDSLTLRQIFPRWMQETYFVSKYIKIRQAPSNRGGDGAFLVYLNPLK
jgi:DNA-nicking Smr family endonuclease